MKEGMPRTPREEVAQASLEGNVRMPRNPLGITVMVAERLVAQEDPRAAVQGLVAPIPDDENLTRRTEKVNAQHALHSIGHVLTTAEVKKVLQSGNVYTLNLIAGALGFNSPIQDQDLYPQDTEGNWASEELRTRARDIGDVLIPQTTESLRALLTATKEALERPDIKNILAQHKALYKGWEDLNEKRRNEIREEARALINDGIQMITEEIWKAGAERGDTLSKNIADNLMRVVGSYMQKAEPVTGRG